MSLPSNAASARGGVLWGRFHFASSGLFQDPNGRFNAFVSQVREANDQLAAQLAEKVALSLRQSLERPRTSSGMLEKAILDVRNRRSDVGGFGVGIPSFLDESAAKYWEQIEAGSTAHLGQQLRGLWGSSMSYVGPDYVPGDPYSQRIVGGQLSPFGAPAGEAFQPLSRTDAQRALRSRGVKPALAKRTRGVIRHAIEPHEYFERGWEALGGIRAIERAYDRAFASVGLRVRWVDGRLAPSARRALTAR